LTTVDAAFADIISDPAFVESVVMLYMLLYEILYFSKMSVG